MNELVYFFVLKFNSTMQVKQGVVKSKKNITEQIICRNTSNKLIKFRIS